MKKIYLNYVCLFSGVVLFIISDAIAYDGTPGLTLLLAGVFLILLGFMIGNNPAKVIFEFIKSLL